MKKYSSSFFVAVFLILAANVFSQKNPPVIRDDSKFAVSKNDANPLITRPRITEPKPAVNVFELEKLAFDLINKRRAAAGLKSLIWSHDAAKIARLHSNNMAENKYFSHRGLDGSMIGERADSLGVKKWRAIGENIAYNRGYENPTEFAVECWIKSDGHRQNLLDDRWKETGVGIAIAKDGSYYFTQVFLLRK